MLDVFSLPFVIEVSNWDGMLFLGSARKGLLCTQFRLVDGHCIRNPAHILLLTASYHTN